MRIFVIGGTGHVGVQLVSILVKQGHEVVIGARTNRLAGNPLLEGAEYLFCDSSDMTSLEKIAETEIFDTIIDFPGTAWNVWTVFKDKVSHIIACGSVWMFGKTKVVPTPEVKQDVCFFEGYERRYQQIVKMLAESKNTKAAFTAIMPTNICGPGKIPLDMTGDRSIEVHLAHMRGETVYLPDGPEALIMPCDVYDLGMLFALATNNREKAAGQIFNAGTEYALTGTELAKAFSDIYEVEIPVVYVPWEEYKTKYNPPIGNWWHFYAHMCPDISKAKTLLGYKPKYTSEETLRRAVDWMKEEGLL